jgi:hypothetical protein
MGTLPVSSYTYNHDEESEATAENLLDASARILRDQSELEKRIQLANDKQQQMDERNRQLESKLAEAARCLEILENDNAKKTRLIQELEHGLLPTVPRRGYLLLRGRSWIGGWKPMRVMLVGCVLLYFNERRGCCVRYCEPSAVETGPPKGDILLSGAVVSDGGANAPKEFSVRPEGSRRIFWFRANTEAEAQEWLAALAYAQRNVRATESARPVTSARESRRISRLGEASPGRLEASPGRL